MPDNFSPLNTSRYRSAGLCLATLSFALWGLGANQALAGLDRESDTDGFDPAAESYRINEARRMNEISRQLELNYRMIWDHGFNPASPPVRQPLGHESKQVGPNRWIYRPIYPDDVVDEGYPGGGYGGESPNDEVNGPELLPSPASPATSSPRGAGPQMVNPSPVPPRPLPPIPRSGATGAGVKLPGPADAQPGDQVAPALVPPLKRGPREF